MWYRKDCSVAFIPGPQGQPANPASRPGSPFRPGMQPTGAVPPASLPARPHAPVHIPDMPFGTTADQTHFGKCGEQQNPDILMSGFCCYRPGEKNQRQDFVGTVPGKRTNVRISLLPFWECSKTGVFCNFGWKQMSGFCCYRSGEKKECQDFVATAPGKKRNVRTLLLPEILDNWLQGICASADFGLPCSWLDPPSK